MVAKRRVGRPTKDEAVQHAATPGGPGVGGLLELLASAVKQQAVEPNMLAYKPHAKQEEFHRSESKGRLFIGGNRSGKSVAGVVEDLWWATGRHPYRRIDTPIRGRVTGSSFEQGIGAVLFPIFKRWIVPSDLINGSWEDSYSSQSRRLTLANKSVIDFLSYDQDLVKHAGTSRHFIHFDEEPPKKIFDENLQRLRDTGGSFWITETPVEGMTWLYHDVYKPWLDGRLKNLFVVEVEQDENIYLPPSEQTQIIEDLQDDDTKAIRKSGKFVPKGGKVFPDWHNGLPYVLPGKWRPTGPEWRVFMSLDAGWRAPTAVLWHAVNPRNQVITFKEYYQSYKTIDKIAQFIHNFERTELPNNPVYLRVGDPAMKQVSQQTGMSTLSQYSEHGVHIGVQGIPKDVNVGLERMTRYLRPRESNDGMPMWQTTDECEKFIGEMEQYQWDYYASSKLQDKNDPKPKPLKKNDHAIDSSRYFFTSMPDLAPEAGEEQLDEFGTGLIDTLLEAQHAVRPGEGIHRPYRPEPLHPAAAALTNWTQQSFGFGGWESD